MDHERSNTRPGDQPDQVHWCPTCIPVSIVSDLALSDPTSCQDRDRAILEPVIVSSRWSIYRVELGESSPALGRDPALFVDQHRWVDSRMHPYLTRESVSRSLCNGNASYCSLFCGNPIT